MHRHRLSFDCDLYTFLRPSKLRLQLRVLYNLFLLELATRCKYHFHMATPVL